MNNDIMTVLTDTATKLGIAVEKLWPIMVKQQFLSSMLGMVVCGSLIIFDIWAWIAFLKKVNGNGNGNYPWDDGELLLAIIIIVVFLILIMNILCLLPGCVYPEASVIKGLVGK
jgi:Kef-type K+ transport system membrane component KefB